MTEPSTPTTHSYNTTPSPVQPTDASESQNHPAVGQPSLAPAAAPKRKRHLFRKVFFGFVACVGLLILLVAIAKPEAAVNAVAPGALPTTIPTSDVYVPPGAASSPSAASAAPLAFGATYKWSDGIQATAGKPQIFKPSKTSTTTAGAVRYVTLEISIANGTTANYDSSSTVVNASVNGEAADRVFDSASKVGGPPQTELLPGRVATFRVAFAVMTKDPVEFQVEIGPGYGVAYSTAIYLGSI